MGVVAVVPVEKNGFPPGENVVCLLRLILNINLFKYDY